MTKPLRSKLRALGLMSGTSMDGINVALITTDGQASLTRGASASFAYPADFQARLRQGLEDVKAMLEGNERPGALADLERDLTERHAEAVRAFLAAQGIAPAAIDVIGFHGQTVLHRPESQLTVQLGDGQLLAELTGIDVVFDMRAADVAAGGQGAPLVPVYHHALAAERAERPIAFLNIGGVANVTWIGAANELGDELIAFDTGPGNALIDDWVRAKSGESWDEGGRLAAAGRLDDAALAHLLAAPFFAAPPPKSLDRNAFDASALQHLSPADGAATLTAFTAAAVSKAAALFPAPAQLWIVSGGGAKNLTMMAMLGKVLAAPVITADSIGLSSASVEAEAWAYLAVRSLRGLPLSFPKTTGAPAPITGGVLARGKA